MSSIYFWPGLSHIGQDIRSMKELQVAFDPGKIHHPQYGFFLSYALAPVYGKISLATNVVTNLNLSMYFGLGALALDLDYSRYSSDMRWTYAGWMEFNQKVFIGKRFYFHGSLSFLIYHAPNPVWCIDRDVEREEDLTDDFCNFYANRREMMSYEKTEKSILFRIITGGGIGFLLF